MSGEREEDNERSAESCPVCNEHALHLLYFPSVDVTGARAYDDMLGFGDIKADAEPGIGCDACGAEWATLDAFRAAQAGETTEEPPRKS